MRGNSARNLTLTAYDEIFQTDAEREDSKHGRIIDIPLSELHSFTTHPFKVRDDDAMKELVDSIRKNGVTEPGLARPRQDGGYELIAGHRRKRASELAGRNSMPVIVRELDDDEATLIMVDSNLTHRETLLFSEKAYAYKMKIEAVKRQAGRPSKHIGSRTPERAGAFMSCANGSTRNSCADQLQFGTDFTGKRSYEIVGEQSGESKNQVYRFVRLTELITGLMEMVDSKRIGFSPAVELSYLTKDEQRLLLGEIEKEESTPSLSQAQRMKKHSQEGTLTEDVIDEIMREVKKEEVKITLTGEKLKKYFPGFSTPKEIEEIIIKLLDGWISRKQKKLQE